MRFFESIWVLCSVALASLQLERGGAFGCFVVLYGFGRFFLERARGDPFRFYAAGFSEAQWTSLLLMSAVAGAELGGVLPFALWHLLLALAVALSAAAIALHRALKGSGAHLLSHPRHVEELAIAVAELRSGRDGILIGRTSLGIDVAMPRPGVFTFARTGGELAESDARTLARWLAHLSGFDGVPAFEHRAGIAEVSLPVEQGFDFSAMPILPGAGAAGEGRGPADSRSTIDR